METDLLFILTTTSQYKSDSESGVYEPLSLKDKGFITALYTNQVEQQANSEQYTEQDELLLLVVDHLRIQAPIKNEDVSGSGIHPHIYGSFKLDAIIDKIKIRKGEGKRFFIDIKHYD